jgi:hypothetical protein
LEGILSLNLNIICEINIKNPYFLLSITYSKKKKSFLGRAIFQSFFGIKRVFLAEKIRKNPGKQKHSKISSVIPKTPDSLSTSKKSLYSNAESERIFSCISHKAILYIGTLLHLTPT